MKLQRIFKIVLDIAKEMIPCYKEDIEGYTLSVTDLPSEDTIIQTGIYSCFQSTYHSSQRKAAHSNNY